MPSVGSAKAIAEGDYDVFRSLRERMSTRRPARRAAKPERALRKRHERTQGATVTNAVRARQEAAGRSRPAHRGVDAAACRRESALYDVTGPPPARFATSSRTTQTYAVEELPARRPGRRRKARRLGATPRETEGSLVVARRTAWGRSSCITQLSAPSTVDLPLRRAGCRRRTSIAVCPGRNAPGRAVASVAAAKLAGDYPVAARSRRSRRRPCRDRTRPVPRVPERAQGRAGVRGACGTTPVRLSDGA